MQSEPNGTPGAPADAIACPADGVPDDAVADDRISSGGVPPVVDIEDLDWVAVRNAVDPAGIRARVRDTVEQLEALLDHEGGPGLLFDAYRETSNDRAIRVTDLDPDVPVWFIGDLHGDLLALEAALALVRRGVLT